MTGWPKYTLTLPLIHLRGCAPLTRAPARRLLRWEALRWKLASKRLVFKQNLPAVLWFHQFLKPWVHYIPVATDLSDLEEKWKWAESHPEEAHRIAEAGAVVGRSPAPRSAAQDFATALWLASVPTLEGDTLGRRLKYCHYGACADAKTMECSDFRDHDHS